MKMKYIFSALLATCLFALASCRNDDGLDESTEQSDGSVVLTFGLSLDEATRSITSDDEGTVLTTYWTTDDKVTLGITHDGTTTYQDVSVNQVSDDGLKAYVSLTVNAADVATDDAITVFYPAVGLTSSVTTISDELNFTYQDGLAASLKNFDLRQGKSTLVVDGTTATLASNLTLSSVLTAYLGVKCVDANNAAISVKEFTVRPANSTDSPSWYTWYSKATLSDEGISNEYWGALMITNATATTGRTYVAMPVANSGLSAVYTAITSDGKVYAATKIWTGEAGDYYPVTLTMTEVTLPEVVDFGLNVKWSKSDLGATDENGTNANYYAFAEISPRTGNSWSYAFATTPYQTNTSANGADDTAWSKYNDNSASGDVVLESCDDAATVMYGSKWRMPTRAEVLELLNNGTVTESNGTYTISNSSNTASITVPEINYRYASNTSHTPVIRRWSSTQMYANQTNIVSANAIGWYLNTDNSNTSKGTSNYNRYWGYPIRPVYVNNE